MKAIVESLAFTPFIYKLVNQILLQRKIDPNASDREIVRAIFYWIKDHIKFVDDETLLAQRLGIDPTLNNGMELLISPDVLMTMNPPSGDCDDFSLLAATILRNLKFLYKYVTIACDSIEPERFSHIYLKVYLEDEGNWISLDCSHGPLPGWEFNDGKVDYQKCFQKVEWN